MSVETSGEEFKKARQKDVELPLFTQIMLKLVSEESNLKSESIRSAISVSCTFLPIYNLSLQEFNGDRPTQVEMALPAAISELFAYRLSRCAGFNHVAPVKLRTKEPVDFDNFVKERNGVLIVSQRIPKTLPLYFLSKKIATTPAYNSHRIDDLILNYISGVDDWVRGGFIDALDKRCCVNREQYNDFTEDMESEKVLDAAMWNSPQRLFSYVYSAFLHSSHCHNSNVLVDVDGLLWQIDFEKIVFSKGASDIAKVFEAVKTSEKVMRVCRNISAISEKHIESALSGINTKYWSHEPAIFTEPSGAIDYFTHRLRLWKQYFNPVVQQIYN